MQKVLGKMNDLDKVYDPTDFRKLGHQVVDMLANHIEKVQSDVDHPVLPYRDPEEELAYWKEDYGSNTGILEVFQNTLEHSISVHHPRYIGHQVAVPALVSGLAGLMSDLLSNGTGVYEMGMASNAMEKIITDLVSKKIGFNSNASGFLTSGGTLANLTALLAARKAKAPSAIWEEGHQEKLAIMVSEEAHYCIDRAARILGMGNEGIVKIPVDNDFKIDTGVLNEYYDQTIKKGFHVIAIIGCACSTATGSYDDLESLADFAANKDLWFHVDGAHGGAVVFSDQHKHLVTGISRADSVVIDFHKMLMTPSLNTGLIFKRSEDAYKTFQQQAQYLWDSQHSKEWYNSGKRTFECTKSMMAIKTYSILKMYGEEVFAQNVDRLYAMASVFAKMIAQRPDFELALLPEANIVNFRYISQQTESINDLNSRIRKELIASGKFYIVQTRIQGELYLRVTVMNALTQESDLEALLDEIENIVKRQS